MWSRIYAVTLWNSEGQNYSVNCRHEQTGSASVHSNMPHLERSLVPLLDCKYKENLQIKYASLCPPHKLKCSDSRGTTVGFRSAVSHWCAWGSISLFHQNEKTRCMGSHHQHVHRARFGLHVMLLMSATLISCNFCRTIPQNMSDMSMALSCIWHRCSWRSK